MDAQRGKGVYDASIAGIRQLNALGYGRPGTGVVLREGMFFTVEPMINYGKPECTISREDGWTAPTADGSASAQWEHTVYITKDGYEILTD